MTDTQREEFEAQMVQQGRIRPFLRDPEGDYTDMRMYWAWRGFQAAQAADAGREAAINAELVEALEGVIRVADRATDEFDRARTALSRAKEQKS